MTFATPWPAWSPCAHPSTLSLDQRLLSEVVWSSDDAATAIRFAPQSLTNPARLARTFPGSRLRRLEVEASREALQSVLVLRLGCRGESSIGWGPCAGDTCRVTATYAVPRMYKALRTEHWTTPTRTPSPYDDWPDVHYSRFKQRIGWRKGGDAEIERQSLRLTRDIVADLLDCLTAACTAGRCAEPIQAAEARLRAYLADRDARFVPSEMGKEYNHWTTGWRWRATAGATSLEVKCVDIDESPQVFCSLELDVGDGLRVIYFPRNAYSSGSYDVIVADRPDWDAEHPIGNIAFHEAHGAARLEIGGRALELEPVRTAPRGVVRE
jgi:hypothetical protein